MVGKAMLVNVEFVGAIRRPWPEQRRTLELAEGTRVADLLAELGYERRERRYVTAVVNEERVKHDRALAEGDRVVLMTVIGGG